MAQTKQRPNHDSKNRTRQSVLHELEQTNPGEFKEGATEEHIFCQLCHQPLKWIRATTISYHINGKPGSEKKAHQEKLNQWKRGKQGQGTLEAMFNRGRAEAKVEREREISGAHMNIAKGTASGAQGIEKVSDVVLGGFNTAARAVGGVVAPKPGQTPGTVRSYAGATVDAVIDVTAAAKGGASQVVGTAADKSKGYVGVVYGDQAAEVAGHYGTAAKSTTKAGLNVTGISPTGFVKQAAKGAVGGYTGNPHLSGQAPVPGTQPGTYSQPPAGVPPATTGMPQQGTYSATPYGVPPAGAPPPQAYQPHQ